VWQRPQQVLSRFARNHAVLYFNEPKIGRPDIQPRLWQVAEDQNLTAFQPFFPHKAEFMEGWNSFYVALVRDCLMSRGWIQPDGSGTIAARPLVGWFYTPMSVYFIDHLPLDLVVYDMMDELANFKGAHECLPEREAQMFERADIVFAGSPSLYELKKHRHHDMHLFSSGVRLADFAPENREALSAPLELLGVERPIIGFYGVIDERLDIELLDAVAKLRPRWTWVMVGPVLKIDKSSLPALPNIIYTGPKDYNELQKYLAAFDVAVIPFAMNDATKYLRPTKTLEYMAAHKPIVSTPLKDVIDGFGTVVRVAATPEEFIGQVEAALAEGEQARAKRLCLEQEILAPYSWDYIVGAMRALVVDQLARRIATHS
jgi:UDP-galactopyranose mutase